MFYALLADGITAFHFLYVAFVVLGELAILVGAAFRCSWARNPWFRGIHLLAIAAVAFEAAFQLPCPFTVWEDALRHAAGQVTSGESFIGRWVHYFFMDAPEARFSEEVYNYIHMGFGALVLATLVLIPPRLRRKAKTSSSTGHAMAA